MDRDIKKVIENNIRLYQKRSSWKKIVGILSFFAFCLTIYVLILPATALMEENLYTLHLRDSYNDYTWKEENGYTTEYDLKLHFMDTSGNYIEGKDVTIEIGPDNLADNPYGFGMVPTSGGSTRGADLIDVLNLEEHIVSTGEKYVFDHAEVYVNGAWQTFSDSGNHWHIWCQSASSSAIPASYGWRGHYNESTSYTITNDTEYKFVYRLVRLGNDKTVSSLGMDSGITFKMFNYFGDNDETGINDNGIYDYFTFRDSSKETATKINTELDADGFGENRAKVLPNLDSEGYPVFNCQGKCSENPSLGYLFGSSKNPKGVTPNGVVSYNPTNTLLQKETIEDVEYYYYDSTKNAVDYDTDNNRFLVRNYQERGYSISTYKNEGDRYEFLPFNYLTNLDETHTNPTTSLTYHYDLDEKDNWYGMTMEFEFYMPKDGMLKGKDMIFSFSGDDDVWVFIDDVLVLDLGGTHGAVDGTINFRTGEVEGYLNWNNTVGDANVTNIYQAYEMANSLDKVKWQDINSQTNKIFANYTKHTLKFFYLERGAAVANCKIRFNIPVLPSGSLSVQKQFEEIERYDDSYEFMLYDVTANAPVVNTEYTIGDNKYTTDEFGKFTLKNTEIATFKLINEHKYYVEETNTGQHAVSYQCSFNGEDCLESNKTPEFEINPESAYQAVFTNKVKTYQLKVKKIAYASVDETFKFRLHLKYNDGTFVDIEENISSNNDLEIDNTSGTITYYLKNNEQIIIEGIPIDVIVTLEEVEHDGYTTIMKTNDIVLANGDIYEFVMDADKDITVYNIPGVTLPDTGGSGLKWYIMVGTCFLVISLKYGYHYLIKKKEGG